MDFAFATINYAAATPTEPVSWLKEANAYVHEGLYKWAFLSIRDRAIKAADVFFRDAHPASRLYCTGHSLGGAMATFSAAELSARHPGRVSLYSFGSPRCGDVSFAAAFTANVADAHRVKFADDIITNVAPMGGIMRYTHVGNTVRYFETVTPNAKFTQCGWTESESCGDLLSSFAGLSHPNAVWTRMVDVMTMHGGYRSTSLSCLHATPNSTEVIAMLQPDKLGTMLYDVVQKACPALPDLSRFTQAATQAQQAFSQMTNTVEQAKQAVANAFTNTVKQIQNGWPWFLGHK